MKMIPSMTLKLKKGFLRFYLFIFLERRERREKEWERSINVWLPPVRPPLGTWPTTQACALSGNQTGDPSVRRTAVKSTEPHQREHETQNCKH